MHSNWCVSPLEDFYVFLCILLAFEYCLFPPQLPQKSFRLVGGLAFSCVCAKKHEQTEERKICSSAVSDFWGGCGLLFVFLARKDRKKGPHTPSGFYILYQPAR